MPVVSSFGRRAAKAAAEAAAARAEAARRMANGLNNPNWSMPNGVGSGTGLDDLAINPNQVDNLDVMPEDLVDPNVVDPYPVVPENWEDVIPPEVTLRPGEDPNLAGAAAPIDLFPDIDTPRPQAPNDMPVTRPSRPSPDLDDAVPNRNAAPDPSDARARALALATLGGAGIVSMYNFFPPGGATPDGFPPTSPPTESPPGGDFRFDPPFPGPDGRNDPADDPTDGMSPVTPQMRRARVDEEARLRRLARRAGITPAEARAMAQAGYDEQDIGHVIGKTATSPNFDQRRQAYMTLREAGGGYQDARLADRQAEVVARAQRQYNPMATLSPEWRDFVMADRLLRDSRNVGASPNDIRQAAEQAKAAMESRLGVGRGFQPNSVQEQLAQQQLDAAKPVAVRAQEHAAAGRLNHPDVLKYADDLVHANYSSRPGMLGVSSRFTDAELDEAAARMASDLSIPEEDAREVLVRVQQDRNRSAVASSIVASFYDR
jgi:hypothetical protein